MKIKNYLNWILLVFLLNITLSGNAAFAEKTRIAYFTKIDNNYYRGNQPDNKDLKDFAKLGIRTIINLRLSNNEKDAIQENIAEQYDIKYVNIPINPFTAPTYEQVNYFFGILNNPKNLPVFVHCQQGKDRTGLMTALYRIKFCHWSYDEAYAEMKDYDYHRVLYPGLKHFLHDYADLENSGHNLAIQGQINL